MFRPTPRLIWLTAAAVAVAGAVYVWDEWFKYRFVAKRFGVVVPGLVYRSGQISKWKIASVLDRHRIEVVVDLQAFDIADEHQQTEVAEAKRRGIEIERFPLKGDGTGEVDRYAEAVAVVARCAAEGRPVLVHCGSGAKRTGGVVVLYRTLIEGRPAEDAYVELQRYGWRANNQTLVRFLNANMPELARRLVEQGVLHALPEPLPVINPADEANRRRSPELANDAGLSKFP